MNSAVVVIDVQSILFDPEPQPYERDLVLEKINQLTGWARANNVPVIYVQHEQAGTPIEYGTSGWQLQSSLTVVAGDRFVRKTTPDSFLKTDLGAQLKELDVEHLIVCGYATEFCIDTTTRKAASLGYTVSLVADAHTTQDKQHMSGEMIRAHHNATLSAIGSFAGKITAVPTDSIISQIGLG